MKSFSWRIVVILLIVGFVLRVWGAFDITEYTDDEYVQVPSAISLFKYGTVEELQWAHPPLSSIILYGTISLFGDNPYGWRSGNVAFGTASILLIYLIGRRLYANENIAVLAAGLLAFDPFHIDFSRNTFMETPTSCFFMMFLLFMLQYWQKGSKWLLPAGIALGLMISTKAYYLFTFPVVIIYVLYQKYLIRQLPREELVDIVVQLGVLPICIYVFSFSHWFGRGYTLAEFLHMKDDAIWMVKKIDFDYFVAKQTLLAGGRPWQWFLKPILFGFKIFSEGTNARYLLEINNFPFRMLVIPSMCFIGFRAWATRCGHEVFVPVMFLICYSMFLVVNRPVFSSNAVVLLPFAYLMLARSVVLAGQLVKREEALSKSFLCVVILWGFYTYPLVSGKLVPAVLYQPFISMTNLLNG